ncbi:MAG: enediyne biosynthesis protein [Frankiaceae bacterium]
MANPAPTPYRDAKVVTALRNFAFSITVFNIVGYTVLGFEQPWVWPFIALLVGYTTEIGLELIGSRAERRTPRFLGNGVRGVREFLYPAHITSLALNMLIYVNDRIMVMVFGVVVAIGAKWMLRAPVRGRLRHFMNPSNLGITTILLVYPWASIAPPYHFSEHVHGIVDWLIVVGILMAGTMLNGMLTGRMWLIGAWLVTFALQAVFRGLLTGTSIQGGLAMMTGIAFVLFTNYMVTDPGTSPSKRGSQIAFGAGVATVYGLLMSAHVAYGIFFATTTVCLIRGGFLWALHFVERSRVAREAQLNRAVGDQSAPALSGPSNRESVPA